jgi:hypothetical protein
VEARMYTLVKTGEVIKVNPRVVVDIYKFARHYIQWDPQEYFNKVDKMRPNRLENYVYTEIPINVVLLPTYMISPIPPSFKGIIKPKRRDVIYPENFSYFDLYKVVEDPNGKITDAVVSAGIVHRRLEDVVGIRSLSLTLDYLRSSYPYQSLFLFTNLDEFFTSENILENILKVLRWARGRSYSNFSRENSRLMRKLLYFEETFTVFLNFLYTLHTHEFDDTDMVGWLFKPYSELVKGFGCKFEDAISVVKVVSAFSL